MLKNSSEITRNTIITYLSGVKFEQLNGSLCIYQKTYIERLDLKFKDLPKCYVKLLFKIGYILPKMKIVCRK